MTASPTPAPNPPGAHVSSVSSPTSTLIADVHQATQRAADASSTALCTSGDGTVCGLMRDAGFSQGAAQALTRYGLPLLQIVAILVVALLIRALVVRLVRRLAEHIATGEARGGRLGRPASAEPGTEEGVVAWERRAQRARTVGSVLTSLTTGTVTVLAALLILGVVGLNLAPLLAGASVIGVAVGFGAQSLVKDVLSGVFLIAEDQFGVGDNVDLSAGATGTVEAVGLRVTRLRNVDGTVWYVRNGEVLRVGNRSQGWARAVVDVEVGYGEDVSAVEAAMGAAGAAVQAEEAWRARLLEEPTVWGLEALTAEKVVVRLAARTAPGEQWAVARELRRRIKDAFDAAGIGHEVQASTT